MTHPRPIPKEALPVVHRLRLEVPRKGFEVFKITEGRRIFRSSGPLKVSFESAFEYSDYSGEPGHGYIEAPPHQIQFWEGEAVTIEWEPQIDGRRCAHCGSRPVDPAKGTVPLLFPCVDCDREVCGECGDVEGDPDGNDGARCPGCREAA